MTEAAWRPVARSRAYELVVDQIEEQILAGSLRVGERLPGERELAARLEVSRAAVREAIRTLEAQGVVRSSVGSGPDAGTVVSAVPSEALNRLLRLHVALANFPMRDVVEARVMLERFSATLAAAHADEARLAHLLALLEAMDDTGIDRERFNDLDTDFHIAIAEAGGNRLVADMTIAIRDSTRRPILRGLEGLGDSWTEVCADLRHEHRRLYDAILAGDAGAAADEVETHIRGTSRWLPGALD
ncbi:FCD domain-containing protein [Nocardioides sp. BP30]|uniref:FadR/GntR family transcriptional regulator n=1 Tax=Nocardioides sp. BP30 TaxID=3036374 RepID=UPI0024696775|nr:FCD domain-containing protein [Nocardioides sp. BP30]WGL51857.1 FCD domain-containing protein [Nocardioides sp. BP30]